MEDCVFCKIIKGEIPSYKIAEDDQFLAFLSIAPHHSGHTLVVPKSHTDYFFDLNDDQIAEIMHFSRPIAKALKQVFNPKLGKVGVLVAGGEVPHVHVHLIPMDDEANLSFASARHDVTEEEFLAVQQKIKSAL
ncbi:HIT family protein [Candidatus Daviesbacteria bacterium]|nr:HIT family protein [Candidatus Daviesbacteria bacterium]